MTQASGDPLSTAAVRAYRVRVVIDGHHHDLVVMADSATAAAAQLGTHQANAARDRSLHTNYPTPIGGRVDIRWGRAAVVTLGEIDELPELELDARNR